MSPASRIREATIHYRGRPRSASIGGPYDLARFVRGVVTDHAREHIVCVWADGRRVPIGWHLVGVGTATEALVAPREVYQSPLMAGAVSIMLAHTHPTGDISPSQEDYGVTLRLIEAGRILGIPLEDHVVVSLYNQSCVSIREANPSLWAKV